MFTATAHTAHSAQLLTLFRNTALEQDQHDDMLKLDVNQPTGNFFYDPWQLKPQYTGTVLHTLLDQLGNVGQAKIVSIPPGQCYLAHSDVEDRYHVTLQSEHSYVMDISNQKTHPCRVDDCVYHMNTAQLHSVMNAGYVPRIQLVVRQLLTRHQLVDPVHILIEATQAHHNLRQQWDQSILVWCNLANKQGIMTNFDPMDSEARVQFDMESSHLDSLKEVLGQCGFSTELSTSTKLTKPS